MNSPAQHDTDGPLSNGALRIVTDLGELARELRKRTRSIDDVLDYVSSAAVSMIPDADYACVSVAAGNERTIRASTSDIADELCAIQFDLGEGPIENEIFHLDSVVSDDLESEPRWPAFAARAGVLGVRSLAAFQLYTDTGDLGVLIVYSRRSAAFGADSVVIGGSLAAHASIAWASARDGGDFRAGLASRDIIGQAKGMLMERYDVDSVHAFELLRALSQSQNQPLHLIARDLVEIDHPLRIDH